MASRAILPQSPNLKTPKQFYYWDKTPTSIKYYILVSTGVLTRYLKWRGHTVTESPSFTPRGDRAECTIESVLFIEFASYRKSLLDRS